MKSDNSGRQYKYCTSCGKQIGAGAKYCSGCGLEFDTYHVPHIASERKIGPGCLSTLVIVLCLFIAIPTCVALFQGEDENTVSSPIKTARPTSVKTPQPTTTAISTSTQTPAATEKIQKPSQSQVILTRDYGWSYGGSDWTWSINIPEALYDYYKQIPRPPTPNYSVYVTHPEDDFYLEMLVDKIKEAAVGAGYNEWETIYFAVSFIQSLPYTVDSVTTTYDEYPRYPIETLVDYGGDCEDTSILMAAIVKEMGYGVVLISLPEHMAVGILGGEGVYGTYWNHDGGKYYYLETTGSGYEIGQLPSEYSGKTATIYDIIPVPILTHSWEATSELFYREKLVVTVENWGTAIADDAYIQAGFDAGDNMLWNPGESVHFDLDPGMYTVVTMYLQIPLNKNTCLVVNVVDDGYSVSSSYSEWFNT